LTWDTLALQQTSGHFHHSSIPSLNDTILLRRIRGCVKVLHTTLITVLLKLNGVKLPSPITSKCTKLIASFSFCQSLNPFEALECFILSCQQFNPHITSMIINNEQEVILATSCTRLDLAI